MQATLESAHEVMDNIDLQTVIDKQTLSLQDATASLVLANNVDKTELKELLNIAMERQTNQENGMLSQSRFLNLLLGLISGLPV